MNRMQIFAEIAALATTITLLPGCSGESKIASTENTGSEQSATSTENNDYVTNHEQVEEIEQEAIENGAYVFKLLK